MITAPSFNVVKSLVEYMRAVPFDVNRKSLYDAHSLYRGYQPGQDDTYATCYDTQVYRHFISTGKQTSLDEESLARSLHDHGINIALDNFFTEHDPHLCLGIMGGHAMLRTDAMYKQITLLSKQLTELGFTLTSGGGPGAMEATHLGAWMADRSDEEVDDALQTLAVAPCFKDAGWLASAFRVMEKYEQSHYASVGIPTWLYGHEPSTPFATHIAKYFENSIREDRILTLPYGGIIYTPGSAGTMQEIFQDAVQNHYLSFGISSPMVFLGTEFWTKEMPAYPLLKSLMETGKYKNLRLTLTDDNETIVTELLRFRNLSESFCL
ncbi:MAG: hypothetical protein IJ775_01335 [Muribaculaceae bacterium]|nr:hypothetical protein [Muribaculaceae bacterium]